MNGSFLVSVTLNGQIYQNIKNLDRKITDFFRHIQGRLSPAKKITLRDRALRVILTSGCQFPARLIAAHTPWSINCEPAVNRQPGYRRADS